MGWQASTPIIVMLAFVALGCGGTSTAMAPVGSDSVDMNEPEPARAPTASRRRSTLLPDVVERAARDFTGLRANGEALSPDELFSELGRASVLCIGEDPAAPHHHWMELTIVRELAKRAPVRGVELGLGLTIFAARDQRWLDQYSAEELGEGELLSVTHYQDSLGLDFALYRPLVEYAVSHGVALVALNAPSELVKRVARGGLEALSPEEVESLPELDMDREAHRRSFGQGRPDPAVAADSGNSCAAEVVSEEVIAEHAARWVNGRRPARQLLILATMKQCERTAIPARLARRDVERILSLRPCGPEEGTSQQPVLESFDYGFVMAPRGTGATTD